ncbi:MAG: hypothetical protein K8L91_31870 [Anaerolineae bacterium]|nr:MAG: hypothetical protein F9K46_05040 [Anaerolineae bacterium]MBZ0321057.1 hypothetical protein [Anaerolineae bacterium]
MTLTTTTPTRTDAELLALLNAMSNGQQNILRQGYNAYSKRQMCFWAKFPATKADAESLMPEYITEIAPNQYKLTDLGVKLYRVWLNQPLARPGADKLPQGYHGTHHSRNRTLRDLWEQKLPSNGLPAVTTEPDAVEIADTPTDEPVSEPVKVSENFQPPVPPTPPQPPTSPMPAVVQLDLTAFMQPLLAEIETLKAQIASASQPAPKPVARRTARAAMPQPIIRRRLGGAA